MVPFGHRPANCLQASGFFFRAERTPQNERKFRRLEARSADLLIAMVDERSENAIRFGVMPLGMESYCTVGGWKPPLLGLRQFILRNLCFKASLRACVLLETESFRGRQFILGNLRFKASLRACVLLGTESFWGNTVANASRFCAKKSWGGTHLPLYSATQWRTFFGLCHSMAKTRRDTIVLAGADLALNRLPFFPHTKHRFFRGFAFKFG